MTYPIQTSIHGDAFGLTQETAGGQRFLGAADGKLAGFSPSVVTKNTVLFDDFLGDVIADQWSAAKGSDGQAVIAAVVAGESGGAVAQTTGDTTVVAESCVSLTHGLNYKAANGDLVFEARVKIDAITTVQQFIGLTDVLATTTLEQPFTINGTTVTSTATDAVGFLFDTDATTDVWHLVGVANDVDATRIQTSIAPVAGTYAKFRIELSAAGVAKFYINDVLVGTMSAAVTASVALTPVVEAMARTTASRVQTVDYVFCSQKR